MTVVIKTRADAYLTNTRSTTHAYYTHSRAPEHWECVLKLTQMLACLVSAPHFRTHTIINLAYTLPPPTYRHTSHTTVNTWLARVEINANSRLVLISTPHIRTHMHMMLAYPFPITNPQTYTICFDVLIMTIIIKLAIKIKLNIIWNYI